MSEIGRKPEEPGFGIKKTNSSLQAGRNDDSKNIRLKRARRKTLELRDEGLNSFPQVKPSRPGAERTLHDPRAVERCRSENGAFIGLDSSTLVIRGISTGGICGQISSSLSDRNIEELGSVVRSVLEALERAERVWIVLQTLQRPTDG